MKVKQVHAEFLFMLLLFLGCISLVLLFLYFTELIIPSTCLYCTHSHYCPYFHLTWAAWLFGTFFPHVILCSTYYIPATVALTSTLNGRQTACPGEVVNYTCTVTQAVLLDWTAEPFINETNRFQFSRSTPAEDRVIDCSDSSTVPCADLDYRATLTSVGPADITSTFRFTASARVNGTVVQCRGSTATGVQTANSTLSVTGVQHIKLSGSKSL